MLTEWVSLMQIAEADLTKQLKSFVAFVTALTFNSCSPTP